MAGHTKQPSNTGQGSTVALKNQVPVLVCKDFWDQELTNQTQPHYAT